jgi:hypothetical protein
MIANDIIQMLESKAPKIWYHGSDNPDITKFKTSATSFALLGKGVYFYKDKKATKKYGKFTYKVSLPNYIKILPLGFKFSDSQIEGLSQDHALDFDRFDITKRFGGARLPIWWVTEGYKFIGKKRDFVAQKMASFIKIMVGVSGMMADYPNGGVVLCLWDQYTELESELIF